MMFKPLRFFSAVSAIFLRSANENEGNSPVVPSTTTPSAPCDFKYASKSLYSSASKFKFLSQGVEAATQKSIFSPEAFAGAASALLRSASFTAFALAATSTPPANVAPPAIPNAAAPADSKNFRRVCIVPPPIAPEV